MVCCNSRLASKRVACSKLHQGDWLAICRSGIFDADGQPLKGYVWVLVTLTAGSYGKVYRVPYRLRDKREKCACGVVHEFGADVAGESIEPWSYDYDGALLFNQSLGRLWNNTTTRWWRSIRQGVPVLRGGPEAQKRGLTHKHVLVRFERGSIFAQELLAVAAESYTAAWTGEVHPLGAAVRCAGARPCR